MKLEADCILIIIIECYYREELIDWDKLKIGESENYREVYYSIRRQYDVEKRRMRYDLKDIETSPELLHPK